MKWDLEKDNLYNYIVIEKRTYEDIGSIYNCTGNNIKKVAKKLGILLEPRRKINESETFNKGKGIKLCMNCGCEYHPVHNDQIFCSSKCYIKYKHNKFIDDWHNGIVDGCNGKTFEVSQHIRQYLFEKYNNSCQCCGWNKVNPITNTTPLQIHHIDGDSKNNSEENLQLLCPNCHSLTENFGRLNKNSTRINRYK